MLLPAQDYSQQILWITLPAVNHRDGDKNIFMSCFGSHFENGRHLENFENAELLL
jgi:hypothetical protein